MQKSIIEIIEKGKIDKKIARCPSCGTVCVFWKEDIKEEYSFHEIFTSTSLRPNFVKCHLCNHHVVNWNNFTEKNEDTV